MITSYSTSRTGNTTVVSVTTTLSGTVFFYWYLDGSYLGSSTDPNWTITLEAGDYGQITAVDSTQSPNVFDTQANAPPGWPARRTLFFVRSIDPNISKYSIEEQANAGTWNTLGYVDDDPSRWDYTFLSDRLTDLTTYAWRVTPVDIYGNTGTPVVLTSEFIVRTPDAPAFVASLNVGTTVTFAA